MKKAQTEELSLLLEQNPRVSRASIELVLRYYELLVAENEVQNLTRLISPKDFYFGHLIDCLELIDSGFLSGVCLDLGSGAGVPGLLCGILNSTHRWALVESEVRKADFLKKCVMDLGLSNQISVFHGRVEVVCNEIKPETVVIRAVGKVEKIYNWLRDCSTWNNLVLLKGPGWELEWEEFCKTSKRRNELRVKTIKDYSPDNEKKRLAILLERVPRGTKKSS